MIWHTGFKGRAHSLPGRLFVFAKKNNHFKLLKNFFKINIFCSNFQDRQIHIWNARIRCLFVQKYLGGSSDKILDHQKIYIWNFLKFLENYYKSYDIYWFPSSKSCDFGFVFLSVEFVDDSERIFGCNKAFRNQYSEKNSTFFKKSE